MKTLKKWLLALAMAGSVAGSWAFFGPNDLTLTTYTESTGGVRFVLSNLPALNVDTARYRVFINPGDGRSSFTEEVPKLTGGATVCTLSTVYYYQNGAQNGSVIYKPYAEVTEIYDDDTKPPGRTVSAPVAPSLSSSADNSCSFGTWAKIEANRKVVPGDRVTYIVTYQNRDRCDQNVHGNIALEYDTSKLQHLWTEKFFGETDSSHTASGNAGSMLWTYLGLAPGEQRNIFFVFETKKSVSDGDTLNPTPTLRFTHGNGSSATGDACADASMSAVHTASSYVATSHDPNGKTVDLKAICVSDDSITYTIRFQNEGNHPAHKVVIEDELHKHLQTGTPRLVAASAGKPDFQYDSQTKKLTVTYGCNSCPQYTLRGLAEPDYGKKFGEEATIGWFTFRAKLPQYIPLLYCQAIPNRAFITFDCNPPIATKEVLTPFQCLDICQNCNVLLDTIVPLIANIAVGDSLPADVFPNWLALKLEQMGVVQRQWYPTQGLIAPKNVNPGFSATYFDKYTLVATGSGCKRVVIHFPITFKGCDLNIEVDPAGLQPTVCAGQKTGYIHAWVTGGTPPYRWQDCATRQVGDQLVMDNYAPGKYYLGVTDANGCTAERWVKIQNPANPLRVDDDPNDCVANLRVNGGSPPYTFSWKYTQGGQKQQFNGSQLELLQTNYARVTVTDSKGCSTVFVPHAANCN